MSSRITGQNQQSTVGVTAGESVDDGNYLSALNAVHGFERSIGDIPVFVVLDTAEELAGSERALKVVEHAHGMLEQADLRDPTFIVNDQFALEKYLPEHPEIFRAAEEALKGAALGEDHPPLVIDTDDVPYTGYIAADLYPEQNAVIFRRAIESELMPSAEPEAGYNPHEFLSTAPAPLPVGGLHEGADGNMYDTCEVFPRFPISERKLAIAFRR